MAYLVLVPNRCVDYYPGRLLNNHDTYPTFEEADAVSDKLNETRRELNLPLFCVAEVTVTANGNFFKRFE